MGDRFAFDGERRGDLGYRPHSTEGKREPRGLLRYSESEWAAIVRVAASAGMRPTSWAQRAAYQAAVGSRSGREVERELVESLVAELRQQRRVLANIGGNLNQLARAANATETVTNPVAAATVLRLVRNTVHAAQELLQRVQVELLD